jgi:hypothetical protein
VFSARKRLTPAELASRKRAGKEVGDDGDGEDAYGD